MSLIDEVIAHLESRGADVPPEDLTADERDAQALARRLRHCQRAAHIRDLLAAD